MIQIEREKLEKVLESLKELVADPECDFGPSYELQEERQEEAITIIKDVLAQSEQEPVGWFGYDQGTSIWFETNKGEDNSVPLYTTPPQRTAEQSSRTLAWVGLTEDERDHLEGLHLYAVRGQVEAWIEGVDDFAQAIEAKLKEKNSA